MPVGVLLGLPVFWFCTAVNAGKWECGERSNLPPEGKNYCAAGDFRQADINLLKVFSPLVVLHTQSFGNADSLNESQSAFAVYRNSQCRAENQRIADKPYHQMLVAQCKTRLTNLRIKELKQMLEKTE